MKIKQSKELVVDTSADYPPLEFTTSVKGNTKYVGIDIELAKDIAKDLRQVGHQNMSFGYFLLPLKLARSTWLFQP